MMIVLQVVLAIFIVVGGIHKNFPYIFSGRTLATISIFIMVYVYNWFY